MKKCECYCEEKKIVGWCNCQQPIYASVRRCNGTRERDVCSCGGDHTKCDFYPEVRKRVQKESAKAVTNADRIRSMTDEELADFLALKLPEGDSDWPDLMLKWLKEPFM